MERWWSQNAIIRWMMNREDVMTCCGYYVRWYHMPCRQRNYTPQLSQCRVVSQCLCKGTCSFIANVVAIITMSRNNNISSEIKKSQLQQKRCLQLLERWWWHVVGIMMASYFVYCNYAPQLIQCIVMLQCLCKGTCSFIADIVKTKTASQNSTYTL